MSISVLNEHKSLNGGEPTTTITYCINTDNLNDTHNKTIRSRGGDLTVPNIRQRSTSGSSTSSFKRLFRSSSKTNNTKSTTDTNKASLSDRCSSIDNVLVNNNETRSDLNRSRSLKAPRQNKNDNKLIVNQQPVQRSKSEYRRHNTCKTNTSIETTPTTSSNFLKPNLVNSQSGDINNGSAIVTAKRPSFMKRISLKLRKSKSVKKPEQSNQQQQKIEENEAITLNLEGNKIK